jgi:cytidyltransferase-like protein
MNNIIIIPGSYKPPHKGHLRMIQKLIKKSVSRIIVIISKKSRPLDSRFLNMNQKSKIDLQNALIEYLPNEKEIIILLSKDKLIKKINELINNQYLKSINCYQSLKIWNIYLKYLKNKYTNKNYFPEIILRISENNNIMIEANRVVLESFKEKPKSIILMKSVKNKTNSRFQFLEERYKKYIETDLFPNIKDIDATGMRKSILENNKLAFSKYLPKNLNLKDINKIWNICSK